MADAEARSQARLKGYHQAFDEDARRRGRLESSMQLRRERVAKQMSKRRTQVRSRNSLFLVVAFLPAARVSRPTRQMLAKPSKVLPVNMPSLRTRGRLLRLCNGQQLWFLLYCAHLPMHSQIQLFHRAGQLVQTPRPRATTLPHQLLASARPRPEWRLQRG